MCERETVFERESERERREMEGSGRAEGEVWALQFQEGRLVTGSARPEGPGTPTEKLIDYCGNCWVINSLMYCFPSETQAQRPTEDILVKWWANQGGGEFE